MRRFEFSRRLEEASCGVRGELLNRGSQVRILSSAPNPNSNRREMCHSRSGWKVQP